HPDLVLILSGDHIYKMDYAVFIAHHLEKKADVTLATIRVPISEASRFGIINTDTDERVVSFVEKPDDPQSNLVNMGVYCFNANILDQALWQDHLTPTSTHDFGKDVIPALVQNGARVFSYYYAGYWMDVGTLESYWEAHMGLLEKPPSFELNDRGWIIHTKTEEHAPVRIETGAKVENSLISDGCVLEPGAEVVHSVLSPGVRISANARIHDSIILTDTVIGHNALIHQSILDKRVHIGANVKIGQPLTEGLRLTTIGRNAMIPDETIIEAGATIGTDVHAPDLPTRHIQSGITIYTRRLPNEL
ncbi:MAG: glucose-1-phosphate adenylyltransferase, partial [Anaerolineae bacterium]|nr:glucose-1-phosphate adenylyltransferase [Anaerolineae bacterium]